MFSFVARDQVAPLKLSTVVCFFGSEDTNRLKLEKIRLIFQVLKLCREKKNREKFANFVFSLVG